MSEIVRIAAVPSGTQDRYLPLHMLGGALAEVAGILMAGLSRNVPGYVISRADASFHHVNICVGGAGWFESDGRKQRFEPGMFVVSPAHVPHAYGCDSGSWDLCWFHVADIDRWANLQKSSLIAGDSPNTGSLKTLMEDFLREATKGQHASLRKAGLQGELMCLYLEELLGVGGESAYTALRHRMETLWAEVDRTLASNWTMKRLASTCGMSISRLLRASAALSEATPMRMVTRLRMLRAQELLLRTAMEVKEVAFTVGYNDEFAFSKAFRRFCGKSPTAFRSTP